MQEGAGEAAAPLSEDVFERHADMIEEGLWLGNEDAGASPLEILRKHNVTHICVPANLSKDRTPYLSGGGEEDGVHCLHLYVADLPDFPLIQLLPECIEFIEKGRASGGTVLVHCAAGKSRSASVVVAYLMKKHGWSFREAHAYCCKKRKIGLKFERQLLLWEQMGCTLDGDSPAHQKCREMYRRSPFNKKTQS